jgi:hypothetical protein
VLQVTPATAPKQLETKNQPRIQRLAWAGECRGIRGRKIPNATQLAQWSVAEATVTTFGARQRMRKGETKICRKLPTNGSDPMIPIEGVDIGNPFVMRADIAMLAGSAIVTIGTATIPSQVEYLRESARSCFFLSAAADAGDPGGAGLSVGMLLRKGDSSSAEPGCTTICSPPAPRPSPGPAAEMPAREGISPRKWKPTRIPDTRSGIGIPLKTGWPSRVRLKGPGGALEKPVRLTSGR